MPPDPLLTKSRVYHVEHYFTFTSSGFSIDQKFIDRLNKVWSPGLDSGLPSSFDLQLSSSLLSLCPASISYKMNMQTSLVLSLPNLLGLLAWNFLFQDFSYYLGVHSLKIFFFARHLVILVLFRLFLFKHLVSLTCLDFFSYQASNPFVLFRLFLYHIFNHSWSSCTFSLPNIQFS